MSGRYRAGYNRVLKLSAKRLKNKGINFKIYRQKQKELKLAGIDPQRCPTPESTPDPSTLYKRRIVDMKLFMDQLKELNNHGSAGCNFSDMDVVSEDVQGLLSCLTLECQVCSCVRTIWTDHVDSNINKEAADAAKSVGCDYSSAEAIFSALSMPSMPQSAFLKENDRSAVAEKMPKEDESAVDKYRLDKETVVMNEKLTRNYPRSDQSSLSGKSSAQPSGLCNKVITLKTEAPDSEASETTLIDNEPTPQSFLNNQKIIIKEEIIETEPGPSTNEDFPFFTRRAESPLALSSSVQNSSLTTCSAEPPTSYHDSQMITEPSPIDLTPTSYNPALVDLRHAESLSSGNDTVSRIQRHAGVTVKSEQWDNGYDTLSKPNPKRSRTSVSTMNEKLPSNELFFWNEVSKLPNGKLDDCGQLIARELHDIDQRSWGFIKSEITHHVFDAELDSLDAIPEPLPVIKEEKQIPSNIDSSSAGQPFAIKLEATVTDSMWLRTCETSFQLQGNPTLQINSFDDRANVKDRSTQNIRLKESVH